MPNEDIDVSNLERLEKYRSFDRYRRRAEQEARAPHWWRTYREHFMVEPGAGARSRGCGCGPRALGAGARLHPALVVLSSQDFHTCWAPCLKNSLSH